MMRTKDIRTMREGQFAWTNVRVKDFEVPAKVPVKILQVNHEKYRVEIVIVASDQTCIWTDANNLWFDC